MLSGKFNFCLFCLRPASRLLLCDQCLSLFPVSGSYCYQCGRLLALQDTCLDCTKVGVATPRLIDNFRFAFWYEAPINQLIKALKFAGKLYLARVLGELLANYLLNLGSKLTWPEVVIPVPLGPKRLVKRGYNQAGEIAKVAARCMHLPLDLTYLERHIDTTAQATLSFKQRRRNLSHAFKIKATSRTYNSVALVDDVFTTKATLESCASVLRSHGVKHIEAWCVAHTRY